ncbi:TetR/AcrR family transcriptional regulator [Nocardiopsis sp. B62]|uniref:TetR/AcrR family transcriptional regulator n=1 Tax=Nocardiopsis sp. B62 TaxID=2824874 RepID=UPI001B35CB58|nr:TetR/AcrR family transcriptional regulator [Nocardiopsis sp. B62]MBQ1082778.1 TetR/AcrR family transcriptional regulator [Nocardiopsis sp. B62]
MNDAGAPPTKPVRKTARDKVLVAALDLFNEQGTAAVSTNHIAKRAGVSPGNLYYWFDGKPAIITALFEQWSEASAPVAPEDGTPEALLIALYATHGANDGHAFRYRGLARELLPLLHTDDRLAERYQRNYRERTALLEGIAAQLVEAGLFRRPDPPGSIGDLVMAAWVLNEFTPPFLQQVERGGAAPDSARATRALLNGLLTERGRRVLDSTHPHERHP